MFQELTNLNRIISYDAIRIGSATDANSHRLQNGSPPRRRYDAPATICRFHSKGIPLPCFCQNRSYISEMRWIVVVLVMCTALCTDMSLHARNLPRDVVRLACSVPNAELERDQIRQLCQQMIQTIAEHAPGRVIRYVPNNDAISSQFGEVGVILEVIGKDPTDLQLRLHWQTAPETVHQTGPSIAFDANRAGITASNLKKITDELLLTNPVLIEALAP